ncbi:hypothetical protein F4782DRAFT_514725 [Xylaria castorea]|nr:hypothetical protein F4782DRAFT_514725 [Xylaria castorea]
MLPSRGLAKNPASALRYSLSSRTKSIRTLSTRQFSQAQSQSSILSRGGISRANASQYGQITPSISAVGYGTSTGIIFSVFAQRSGATRNLSLWPFQSKPEAPQTPETTEIPSQLSAPAEAQPPVYETSSLPTPAEPVSNAAVPYASQTDLSQLSDDLLRGFDSQSWLDIPENIGYLRVLGLDYGWGPTTCCQWLLEHVHIYSGLPWWGSIAVVALLFRSALFYPSLMASKHQARMQKVTTTPEYKKAKTDFDEAAFRSKDQRAMLFARAEMTRLNKAAGVSTFMPLINFVMVPFSFGMFRLVRGMVNIPVPGMETGGLAWFTDLTVHDPFYILPLISTGMALVMFKQMQRANMNPNSNPTQQTIMKAMQYIMPPLMFVGTAWLPAALQWFFFSLSVGTLVQTQATLSPAVRAWGELPPLPNRDAARLAIQGAVQYQSPSKRSFRSSLSNGINAASKSIKEATGATDEKARWKKAKEYEDQRAEQEREKVKRRMEEVRRRRVDRQH